LTALECALPSPKSQSYTSGSLSGSLEPAPVNDTFSGAWPEVGDAEARAVGALLTR
jgi:hypothetical protein